LFPTLVVSALLAGGDFAGGGAVAQNQGTDVQREACTPDAFRLCGQFIPDSSRIEICLRAAGPKLSPACCVVFDPPVEKKPPLRSARRQQQPTTVGQAPAARPAAGAEAVRMEE
jgi:hypothetical protein